MLTTVAVLIVLLGLMVSLARYVRDSSAQDVTRYLLKQLDVLMAQYVEHNHSRFPKIEPLLPYDSVRLPEENELEDIARRNNEECIRALTADYRQHQTSETAADPLGQLPISVYNPKTQTLRDAWGSPIVFMARQHQLIGLAPSRAGQDQSFFFSAGPDRKYLTRDDNLYSYETSPIVSPDSR